MIFNYLELLQSLENERMNPHSYKVNMILHRTYPLVVEGKRAPALR